MIYFYLCHSTSNKALDRNYKINGRVFTKLAYVRLCISESFIHHEKHKLRALRVFVVH